MLDRKKTSQDGFGLVELMVAAAVGFILILASGSTYLSTLNSSNDTTRLTRLNQDMRTILDIMVQDIHRAGYWGFASQGTSNNLFTDRTAGTATDIFISADNTCILYSYDLNQDGAVATDGSEFFGFRYNSATKQVEVLDATGAPDTSGVANCGALSWLPLNLATEITVSSLSFSTKDSRCIAFDPVKFKDSVASTYTTWQLTGQNSVAACDSPPSGSTIDPAQTGRSEIRVITIQLTAASTKDSSFTRTQTESIRVRNDRVS